MKLKRRKEKKRKEKEKEKTPVGCLASPHVRHKHSRASPQHVAASFAESTINTGRHTKHGRQGRFVLCMPFCTFLSRCGCLAGTNRHFCTSPAAVVQLSVCVFVSLLPGSPLSLICLYDLYYEALSYISRASLLEPRFVIVLRG